MDLLTARFLGLNVNPSHPELADNCIECVYFLPQPGATSRCMRLDINIDPTRHRHRAVWCRKEDGVKGGV